LAFSAAAMSRVARDGVIWSKWPSAIVTLAVTLAAASNPPV
jgi:hypothetical protein